MRFSGLAVPLGRLVLVLLYTFPIFVHEADFQLGLGKSEFGRLHEIVEGKKAELA